MPLAMWILLGAGFLLFGGLLVVLVNRGGDPDAEPVVVVVAPPPPRSPLADLPETMPYAQFPGAREPLRVFDMARPEDAARVEEGAWLLIFVLPGSPGDEASFLAAQSMHRRLSIHGVQVGVVLARSAFAGADGGVGTPEALVKRIREEAHAGLGDAIAVVLDTADRQGQGVLRARCDATHKPNVAALLTNGEMQIRTTPPEGGFTEVSLVRIALRALEMARELDDAR